MATATLISLEEYLRTAYHPDCDYVNRMLRERNMEKWNHGGRPGEIVHCRGSPTRMEHPRGHEVGGVPCVTPGRVRIPDVCVISRDHPLEQVVTTPPLICIEVLAR